MTALKDLLGRLETYLLFLGSVVPGLCNSVDRQR